MVVANRASLLFTDDQADSLVRRLSRTSSRSNAKSPSSRTSQTDPETSLTMTSPFATPQVNSAPRKLEPFPEALEHEELQAENEIHDPIDPEDPQDHPENGICICPRYHFVTLNY